MAKTHHTNDVGMMAIQNPDQTPDLPNLRDEFVNVYTGDSISSYQACSRLHSYGYNWDDLNENNWLPTGTTKEERNATAWANYVKAIESANNNVPLGGGAISKALSLGH